MKIVTGSFGRFGKVASGVALIGLGLVFLGGCANKEKDEQITRLNDEVIQLKEEKATLETTNNSLQAQLAAKPSQPTPDSTWDPRNGSNPPGRGGGRRS